MTLEEKPSTGRLHAVWEQLHYLPQSLHLVWAAAARWTIAWVALLVVQGILPVASVFLTRQLVDGIVAARAAGGAMASLQPLLVPGVAMAAIMLLTESLQSASEWIRTAQSELVQDHISGLVHQKSVDVDMAYFESPDYFDRLNRVQGESSSRPIALVEGAGTLMQNGITLLGMATVLTAFGWWVPLVVVASGLPAFSVITAFNRRNHSWWKRTTASRRWAEYYDLMLKHPMVAAELRLFDIGPHFKSAYQELRSRLRSERLAMIRDQAVGRLAAGVFALLLPGIIMAWMGLRALQGSLTLGDLALFYQALTRGQGLIRSLLSNASQIYNNSLYLKNLFEFLELQPKVVCTTATSPAPRRIEEIHLKQITFRYPGSERTALHEFSLTIPAGQTVAIVGANGAGKSTLVKLLCRFYDPDEGCIELNGIDIRNMPVHDLRRLITVLFQSPVPYHATAAQNIAVSDFQSTPDSAAIEAAARAAGAHDIIVRLPSGYDTLLGKVFTDGTDLSGGEWQRVALARAFLRAAEILILDEPTSFMDSWAEVEWLDRFRALARGRTAIIITHRFTTAMRADVIYLMDHGQIVESGSHRDLLTQGGLYATSWAAQMQASHDVEECAAVASPAGHRMDAQSPVG